MSKIAVIGAGAWGTALASLLADNHHQVSVWFYDTESLAKFQATSENPYLPGFKLPKLIGSADLKDVVDDAEMILLSTPCQALPEVLAELAGVTNKDQLIVNVAKGLILPEGKLPLDVVKQFLPNNKLAVLSGPSFATEVASSKVTMVTIASDDEEVAKRLQTMFASKYFRPYASTDVIGVQVGGAVKNVIAIGAGLADALDGGMNIKAALLSRGLKEITRFGMKLGAHKDTFFGLSGLGDLFLTMNSPQSRNYSFGFALGLGQEKIEALHAKGVVEGFYTTAAVMQKAKELGVDMPITNALYQILYHGQDMREAISELMARELKQEFNNF